MPNSTSLSSYMVQVYMSNGKGAEITRLVLSILTLLCFCFFLYFITMILYVYFTTPHVKEQARYTLFTHMIIVDTSYLVLSLVLLLAAVYLIYIPVPICYVLFTLTATTFRITPYTLAAMSLERYAAICFPLRHMELCTPQRSGAAIVFMWVNGLIPSVADFIALSTSVESKFFSLHVICHRETMTVKPVQVTIRTSALIISLILVAIIILFTYVKVMLVARKINSGGSTAFKAGKTVMLHGFQLLLCITSLASSFTEIYFRENVVFFAIGNFLVCMCLPRFLSPLIYGLRDEVFRQGIKKMHPRIFQTTRF
ncbi:odorant receptor 131-2-like [Pelodytes ibericus]